MTPRPAFPLWLKISLIASLNLALLAIALALFVAVQMRQAFDSVLLSAARDRIETIASLLVLDLEETAVADRDALLARRSAEYGVAFVLVRNDASRVAGPAVDVPEEVRVRLRGTPATAFGPRPGEAAGPPPGEGAFGPSPGPGRRPGGSLPFLVVAASAPAYWVGMRVPIRSPEGGDSIPGTLLLASNTFWTNPFFFQMRPWLGVALTAILVTLLCWLPHVRNVTRSISQMMRATGEIAEGRFDVHVSSTRRDELGHLAASITRMAARLEALVHGQKRFLADAAHELRSPLGRMQVELGLIERRAGPDLTAHVADLREDVDQMARLVDELLRYAKTDLVRGEAVPTSLLEIVERVVSREGRSDTEIRTAIDPALRVAAPPDLLSRAVANVLRNAVSHAGAAGPISIHASRDGDHVHLVVADSGPGVPADTLEWLFTPFFRLDDARTSATGGTGLGLAIVRSAVEGCGGSVSCANGSPRGLEVHLRLPAA